MVRLIFMIGLYPKNRPAFLKGNHNSSSGGNKPVEKFEPIEYETNGENIADYKIVDLASELPNIKLGSLCK